MLAPRSRSGVLFTDLELIVLALHREGLNGKGASIAGPMAATAGGTATDSLVCCGVSRLMVWLLFDLVGSSVNVA